MDDFQKGVVYLLVVIDRPFCKLDVEYNLSKLLRNPSSCCDNIKGCDILVNS